MLADATPAIVIDTNIALDLLVFEDPATTDLMTALKAGTVRWIATRAMRDELERVLGYPKLAARIAFHQRDTHTVLAAMDALCDQVADAPKAPVTCTDADDQKFIDLALKLEDLTRNAGNIALQEGEQLVGSGPNSLSLSKSNVETAGNMK